MTEWVHLKSTLLSRDDSRFDCGSCLSKYDARKDREEQTDRMRRVMGCWGGTEVRHKVQDSFGQEMAFTTCPGNFSLPVYHHWIRMHRSFHQGVMPFPGSLLDQPNKALEVFGTIDAHLNEKAGETAKELARKQGPRVPRGTTRRSGGVIA